MSTTPTKPKLTDLRPRIIVIGVGGAGCNAINNMIASGLTGVEFVAANTDAQALQASSAEHRLQLGINLTEGLGAGSKPEIGEAAAEEAIEDIRKQVAGAHMVFIACGMGGGTGTGAAAVLARAARELGILTVAVVTKPFLFEGARRMRVAEAGIAELKKQVDTLIVIPNQNLFRIANEKTTFAEAFLLADQVLYSGVACIVDLILKEGLINLDFADVRTVMSGMGTAMMGTGEAAGERRAIEAAEEAISNPLLDDITLKGAKGLLLSITGGSTLTLYEVDAAASRVRQEVDPEANIIVGATFDSKLEDRVRVSIVASGMARLSTEAPPPLRAADGWPHSSSGSADAHDAGAMTPSHPAPPPAHVDDDMARRLSEALQYDNPPGIYGDPYADDRSPARGRSQTWRAPGDVVIEESVPQSTAHGVGPGYDHPSHGPRRQGAEFSPAPPVDVRRQRRMPDVGDFPVVGQREYLAKSPGAQLRREQDLSNSGNSAHDSHRRGGLLGWLARRISDSGDDQAQSASAPHAGHPHGADAERQGAHAKGTRGQAPHAPAHEVEDVELPVILSRDRK